MKEKNNKRKHRDYPNLENILHKKKCLDRSEEKKLRLSHKKIPIIYHLVSQLIKLKSISNSFPRFFYLFLVETKDLV